MRNGTLIIAALGLVCPLVAHAQGLPLPGEVDRPEPSSQVNAPKQRIAPLAPANRITFTYWPEGVLPRRVVTLTVDLRTGAASARPLGGEVTTVHLSKRSLARVRRAVREASSLKGRIDPPKLTLEASARSKRPVAYDWRAVVVRGKRRIELRDIANPAAQRLGGLMIRLGQRIQRRPTPIRPRPIWPELPRLPRLPGLPKLPRPPFVPIVPIPPIGPIPPIVRLPLDTMDLLRLYARIAARHLPIAPLPVAPLPIAVGAAVARGAQTLWSRLVDKAGEVVGEAVQKGQALQEQPAKQRKGIIDSFSR